VVFFFFFFFTVFLLFCLVFSFFLGVCACGVVKAVVFYPFLLKSLLLF